MKYYKSVLQKVEETNYKKGVVRISTDSSIYKTSKILYYISFAWFMLFHGLYILSNATAFFFYKAAAQNIHTELFITSIIVFVLMIAAIVFVKKNWQIPALALTVVSGVAQIIMLNSNENISLAFLDKGVLANKFFWYHHAPIILLILFVLIIFVIGLKTKINLRKDYNKALASMFTAYSETHPTVSDAEWTAHLEELDKELSEATE